jgi:feruloyl esterase
MTKQVATLAVWVLSLPLAWAQQPAIGDNACAKLVSLSLPTAKIVSAQMVAAGVFTPPGTTQLNPAEKAIYAGVPAFCRVVLMDTPTADSAIPIEVWMPARGWNGKFRGMGNGGFAGSIDYGGLAVAVTEGYSGGATDTGHSGAAYDASWALGHPEKVIDYGYRAIHEMTVKSKAIVEAYYAEPAKRNYFAGCSNGGREALMEAQRYPADYDGIISGAPSYNATHVISNFLYNSRALTLDPGDYIPSAKLSAIHDAVLAACDGADGVADGVINDPRNCHFIPATLVCKGPETDTCLTAKQAHTLDVLYAGGHDSKGNLILPGYLPGSELGANGWGPWIVGPAPGQSGISVFALQYFTNMVYEKRDWDYKKAVIDDALKAAVEKTAHALDATDPNLRPFAARGGKLILYHGWNDPTYSALNTVNYYNDVRKVTGPRETDSFVRLYLVPGMQHCGFGPGAWYFDQAGLPPAALPDDARHDINLALEAWVEKGLAPESMIAAKFAEKEPFTQVLMTRPVCAFPLEVRYNGTGDTNDAANFTCASAAR